MFGQKLLDHLIVEQLVLSESKNLKGLLLGHEPALDAQTLFGDLLAALVAELLHLGLVALLLEVTLHFPHAFRLCYRPDHALGNSKILRRVGALLLEVVVDVLFFQSSLQLLLELERRGFSTKVALLVLANALGRGRLVRARGTCSRNLSGGHRAITRVIVE